MIESSAAKTKSMTNSAMATQGEVEKKDKSWIPYQSSNTLEQLSQMMVQRIAQATAVLTKLKPSERYNTPLGSKAKLVRSSQPSL